MVNATNKKNVRATNQIITMDETMRRHHNGHVS